MAEKDTNHGALAIHFIKTPQCRTIRPDGVYGGVGPKSFVEMTLYTERNPIPQLLTQELIEVGTGKSRLGDITGTAGREGIVREVEAVVSLTPELAVSVRDWLNDKIADMIQLGIIQPEESK